MSSTTDGKLVLKAYHDNGHLSKKTRNLLSRLVIRNEKDRAFLNVTIGQNPDYLDNFM